MPAATGTTRRLLLAVVFSAILVIVFLTSFRNQQPHDSTIPDRDANIDSHLPVVPSGEFSVNPTILTGPAIAPKLGNETIKAELGRAAWKLLHTTMARFPDAPSKEESEALRTYVHLFQRLYPCGECAQHFGQILEKYPPQVSSRSAAAGWACHVHNEVNRSLGKSVFDCSKIGDFYDCGCADDEKEQMNKAGQRRWLEMRGASMEKFIGEDGRSMNHADRMPRERRRHVDSRWTEI